MTKPSPFSGETSARRSLDLGYRVAAALRLHHRNPATDLCRECHKSFPCPTVEALAGEDS